MVLDPNDEERGGEYSPFKPQPKPGVQPPPQPNINMQPSMYPPLPQGQPQGQGQSAFDFFKGELEKQRDDGLASVDADAAKRGVFYSTMPVSAGARVKSDFNAGLGTLASNLAMKQADYGLEAMRLGYSGGYNPQQTSGQMMNMPVGGGANNGTFAGLGQLYGQLSGGQPQPSQPTAPAISPVASSVGGQQPQQQYPQLKKPGDNGYQPDMNLLK